MVYVRIEIWPGGRRSLARVLGEATITNDGTGSEDTGNYRVLLSKIGGFQGRRAPRAQSGSLFLDPLSIPAAEAKDTQESAVSPLEASVWRKGRVEGWNRSGPVWGLLALAFRSAMNR